MDRAAIVTGASSGIGYAIADMLGGEGYALTLAARRADKLEAAAHELAGRGYTVQAVAGDLGHEEAVREVVRRHGDAFGRLDVLVNNAGIGVGRPAAGVASKDIELQLGINLRSLFYFYREALALLRAAAPSLVVNVSSMAGVTAAPELGVYSATKHGVVGYTKSMTAELARDGIRSTVLCPAYVDTPMAEAVKERVPAETMIQVGDVAEAVRYLLRISSACLIPEIQLHQASG